MPLAFYEADDTTFAFYKLWPHGVRQNQKRRQKPVFKDKRDSASCYQKFMLAWREQCIPGCACRLKTRNTSRHLVPVGTQHLFLFCAEVMHRTQALEIRADAAMALEARPRTLLPRRQCSVTPIIWKKNVSSKSTAISSFYFHMALCTMAFLLERQTSAGYAFVLPVFAGLLRRGNGVITSASSITVQWSAAVTCVRQWQRTALEFNNAWHDQQDICMLVKGARTSWKFFLGLCFSAHRRKQVFCSLGVGAKPFVKSHNTASVSTPARFALVPFHLPTEGLSQKTKFWQRKSLMGTSRWLHEKQDVRTCPFGG